MSRLLFFGKNPSPEEFKKHGLQIGTYSEITSRRRCPYQHKFAYVDKLEKKTPGLPLTLGSLGHRLLEAKYSGVGWHKELDLYVKHEWESMFEEQREEYGDLPGEVARLLRGYDYYWKNEQWKTIDTEVSFLIKLTDKIGIAGVIDLIVEDTNGKLWVVDHKFTKAIPEDDYLMMEQQTPIYFFAAMLKYGKDKVAGAILNYIKTKAPTIPRINKDGTLSKAKIDTDIPTLFSVLKEHDLKPEDYKDQIERAKVTSGQFYVRKRLDRPIRLLKTVVTEAAATIHDCQSKRRLTRTISKQCSWDCDFLPICIAELQGMDTDFLIKQQYQVKEDKNKEVFKSCQK